LVQYDLRDKMLELILGYYLEYRPDILQVCKDFDEDPDEVAPEASSVEALKQMIGLNTVFIGHPIEGKRPYIGFEFGCCWDDEHGLGVMTQDDRVLLVGQADEAWPNSYSEPSA
jgi:hypothetical protein